MDEFPPWVYGQVALAALLIAGISFTAWFAADVLTTDLRTRVRYWLSMSGAGCAFTAAVYGLLWLIA